MTNVKETTSPSTLEAALLSAIASKRAKGQVQEDGSSELREEGTRLFLTFQGAISIDEADACVSLVHANNATALAADVRENKRSEKVIELATEAADEAVSDAIEAARIAGGYTGLRRLAWGLSNLFTGNAAREEYRHAQQLVLANQQRMLLSAQTWQLCDQLRSAQKAGKAAKTE